MATNLPMCVVDYMDTTKSVEEQEIADAIRAVRKRLGNRVLILGHHYQRDGIVEHADYVGDSFMLSRKAADSDATVIVFCGVHFMAESADILTREDQAVLMPTLRAGCSMADMATLAEVERDWPTMLAEGGWKDPATRTDPGAPAEEGAAYLVPVTYMNSSAALKDFVGRHGGVVCTSSNAKGVLEWAFERAGLNGAVLFFPDQHLGRNTGLKLGLEEAVMPVWTPDEGATSSMDEARIVLWHGYCSVHERFTVPQIDAFRERYPTGVVVVHPECPRATVEAADDDGSTEHIKRFIEAQPAGSAIAVGTEINMVARMAKEHPDKHIECLDAEVCPCSTMYMIHPAFLLDVLERLEAGEMPNQVAVPADVQQGALVALERMLSITA
jgi:quinolinate synthase